MPDLSQHRLTGTEELNAYRQRLGEKFTLFESAVHKVLADMPYNVWYDYSTHVHNKANIPLFIKIVCGYIDRYRSLTDYVEFSSDFTRIRRMVEQPKQLFDPKKRNTFYTR